MGRRVGDKADWGGNGYQDGKGGCKEAMPLEEGAVAAKLK